MKLVKIVSLLTITTAVSLSSTGCKKGLDKTTQIPGRVPGSITESPAGVRGGIDRGTGIDNTTPPIVSTTTDPTGGRPTTTTLPPEGLEASKKIFDDWSKDYETFKDQTVYFDFDKSVVKASEIPKIEEVVRRMKAEFAGKALKIEGHADERGTEEYNRALGDKRALSVREKFAQGGLDPEMLPTISLGEEQPADPSHNEAAWQKNRRAVLILLSPPTN
jgi:peptidoglycan-associated lipoprotein